MSVLLVFVEKTLVLKRYVFSYDYFYIIYSKNSQKLKLKCIAIAMIVIRVDILFMGLFYSNSEPSW